MTPPFEIWFVDLERCANALIAHDILNPVVAEDDRERCLRLADPSHRRERIAAHVAVRLLLARWGADDGCRRPYRRLPSGKPVIPTSWSPTHALHPTGIDFSLSHIDTAALVAIGRGQPLGIDVERLRPVAIEDGRRVTIEAAAEALPNAGALPAAGDPRRLQQAWTRLEALAKARGIGMARVLAEIGVVGEAWTARESGERSDDAGAALAAGLSVSDLVCPDSDLLAAIARGGRLPDTCTVLAFPASAHLPRL